MDRSSEGKDQIEPNERQLDIRIPEDRPDTLTWNINDSIAIENITIDLAVSPHASPILPWIR